MYEKVNPCHPDKVADRIAGAIVDLAYKAEPAPKIAVEVLIGHGKCHVIIETTAEFDTKAIDDAVHRIAGEVETDIVIVPQDTHLSDNQQNGFRFFGGADEAKEDDFDVDAELQKPTFSKAGDVWRLGRHTLICGDSTKQETYDALLGDTKVNLVLTDPPYNQNYEGSAGKIKNDNMAADKFYQFLLGTFICMEKSMTADASIYIFHAETEGSNFRRAFADAGFHLSGFHLSGCCIWKKQSLVLGRSPYQWQHEPVLYGWKKSGKHQWYGGRKETTIWEFDKPKKNGDHPTMKPIPLLAYPIMNSSMTNTLVLDPFGGSGSTLIACEQADRSCATIELDEKYCDVIVNRYIEQVGTNENVSVFRDGQTLKYEEVKNGTEE